jgi:hypothetical protein
LRCAGAAAEAAGRKNTCPGIERRGTIAVTIRLAAFYRVVCIFRSSSPVATSPLFLIFCPLLSSARFIRIFRPLLSSASFVRFFHPLLRFVYRLSQHRFTVPQGIAVSPRRRPITPARSIPTRAPVFSRSSAH